MERKERERSKYQEWNEGSKEGDDVKEKESNRGRGVKGVVRMYREEGGKRGKVRNKGRAVKGQYFGLRMQRKRRGRRE